MYNGVTVEVTNTDAEGRLVLGDALAWGIETYKPAAVVDLATLTGGVVVALGKTMAGVMSNSDALVDEMQTAADAAGEKIWRLPLGDDQREQIKSDHADIVNSAGREGHPLQGGAFLSYFVPQDDSTSPGPTSTSPASRTRKRSCRITRKGATGLGRADAGRVGRAQRRIPPEARDAAGGGGMKGAPVELDQIPLADPPRRGVVVGVGAVAVGQ